MLNIINEILEDILSDFFDHIENVNEDSLGLTLSDESDHQLPCSEDFQFFLNIARTAPSYSPGSGTQTQPSQVTFQYYLNLPVN